MKVAIQGIEGSFHDAAARTYFDTSVDVVSCQRFADVLDAVRKGLADAAIMAIENSIAGTILPNYTLIRESGFHVTGEIMMRIEHSAIAHAGVSIHDVREVRSHPMALQQCEDFVRELGDVRRVETWDTAGAVQELALDPCRHAAVIAHAQAAAVFGLNVIARGIESNKRNYTRFLIIDPSRDNLSGNKASMCLAVENRSGALVRVLAVFSGLGMNLTKIQSTPIPGREWEYYMHLDVEYSSKEALHKAILALEPLTQQLQLLGIYEKGKTIQ